MYPHAAPAVAPRRSPPRHLPLPHRPRPQAHSANYTASARLRLSRLIRRCNSPRNKPAGPSHRQWPLPPHGRSSQHPPDGQGEHSVLNNPCTKISKITSFSLPTTQLLFTICFGRKSGILLKVFTESELFGEIELFCYLFDIHRTIF